MSFHQLFGTVSAISHYVTGVATPYPTKSTSDFRAMDLYQPKSVLIHLKFSDRLQYRQPKVLSLDRHTKKIYSHIRNTYYKGRSKKTFSNFGLHFYKEIDIYPFSFKDIKFKKI